MTDNEIIKALECHADRDTETCSLCPLMCVEGCAYELAKNSLDLINRQKAEIEALIAGQETLQRYISTAKDEAVKEFAERLCEDRLSNDPVVIAVKVELKTAGEENDKI